MMRRVTDLNRPRISGVCQWRSVLMMRRRSMAMMMMGRRVYVAVPVAHRVMVRARGIVHVVQEVIARRQCIVIEVQHIRQEGLAAPLTKLQVVTLATACFDKLSR